MVYTGLEGPRERKEAGGSACKRGANWCALGAGKNRVEFDYSPTLFRVLMILNRITVVLVLAFYDFLCFAKGTRSQPWLCTILRYVTLISFARHALSILKHLEAWGEGRLLTGAGRLADDHIQPFPNLECAR
jgi:hypothetical protein